MQVEEERRDLRVHEDVSGLEVWVVRPGAGVCDVSTTWKAIIFWEDVDVGNLADISGLRVLRDGGNVVDAETRSVVGLVDVVADDVLIVVDGCGCALVNTSLLWCLEGRNIPDVGDGVLVSSWAAGVDLIGLIWFGLAWTTGIETEKSYHQG